MQEKEIREREKKSIVNISVVGAGLKGTQIWLQCAVHVFQVWFIDISEEALERASESQSKELKKPVETCQITEDEKKKSAKKFHYTTNLKKGMYCADIFIEAVHERLDFKRKIITDADSLYQGHTIIKTSSLSIYISRIEDVF
jgi:3-hydroxybutyryl-CoA dehydrogenase